MNWANSSLNSWNDLERGAFIDCGNFRDIMLNQNCGFSEFRYGAVPGNFLAMGSSVPTLQNNKHIDVTAANVNNSRKNAYKIGFKFTLNIKQY